MWYVVRWSEEAIGFGIKGLGEQAKERGVVISYDTRRKSYEFAYNAAIVLATNGIKAHLFSDVHPVPMLSYAVRELKTVAGIMITAIHRKTHTD